MYKHVREGILGSKYAKQSSDSYSLIYKMNRKEETRGIAKRKSGLRDKSNVGVRPRRWPSELIIRHQVLVIK